MVVTALLPPAPGYPPVAWLVVAPPVLGDPPVDELPPVASTAEPPVAKVSFVVWPPVVVEVVVCAHVAPPLAVMVVVSIVDLPPVAMTEVAVEVDTLVVGMEVSSVDGIPATSVPGPDPPPSLPQAIRVMDSSKPSRNLVVIVFSFYLSYS